LVWAEWNHVNPLGQKVIGDGKTYIAKIIGFNKDSSESIKVEWVQDVQDEEKEDSKKIMSSDILRSSIIKKIRVGDRVYAK